MNPIESILQYLRLKIGLDAASIGVKSVEVAVREAMEECQIKSIENYLQALKDHPQVMTHLVEKLVVPETWFFRDQIPFDVLSSLAKSRAGSGDVIRIASMPCSTGEEPYSIAITMLEAGFQPGSFAVDAVDLSQVSLERARQGLYGPISFRGAKPGFREKYFDQMANGFRIKNEIKKCVQFHHGNLLDPFLLKGREGYEVVFCRNVLIYLDEAAREAALSSFKRLLLPGGLLFVGHAETLQIFNRNFRLLPEASSFGYVYLGESELRPVEDRKPAAIPIKPRLPFPAVAKAKITFTRTLAQKAAATARAPSAGPEKSGSEADPTAELKEIADLADRGKLDEAMEKCRIFLLRSRTVAQGHYLMGVIQAARGLQAAGEESLRRSLYLDPRHHEALVHLALLLDKKGDHKGAELMRGRAERNDNGKEKVTA